MNAQEGWAETLLSRDRLQLWGVIALIVLLIVGLLLFWLQVLAPDIRANREHATALTSSQLDLSLAQRDAELAPTRAQARVESSATRLAVTAADYLDESEASALVRRLYIYAQTAGVEVINQQTPAVTTTDPMGRREVRLQVAGSLEGLFAFLNRIEEAAVEGFLIQNVTITPDQDRHLLAFEAVVFTSPYSSRTLDAEVAAALAQISPAELHRRADAVWRTHDWEGAIRLLQQAITIDEDNRIIRDALYRAHMNYGYQLIKRRELVAARRQFETALLVAPDGREARAEIEQLTEDEAAALRVEDGLRQALRTATAAENWPEAIRLLRVISTFDLGYTTAQDELYQAYIRYGNQLMAQGAVVAAEDAYRAAQELRPDAPWPPADIALAATPTPVPTVTPVSPPSLAPDAIPTAVAPAVAMLPFTATPTFTPTPTPSMTPTPTMTPIVAAPPVGVLPTAVVIPPVGVLPTALPYPPTIPVLPTLPATTTYLVQSGDTLYSIARRFGTTVETLRHTNGLRGDTIRIGQYLVIVPASSGGGRVHVVTYNDTLYSLATRYGTSVAAIQRANGLATTQIYVGQRLTIP